MYAPLPHLNLVVLRSPDIDRAATFYRTMGLILTRHSHGAGPEHYSSEVGGLVLKFTLAHQSSLRLQVHGLGSESTPLMISLNFLNRSEQR